MILINEYCVSLEHLRKAEHKREMYWMDKPIEIPLCDECFERVITSEIITSK